MTPENLTRLRELASAARIEWRVADPATKSYCATFDRSDTLTPEEDAHAWLEDQRKRFPGGRFADYEVIRVEVRTELQLLAAELLDECHQPVMAKPNPAPQRACRLILEMQADTPRELASALHNFAHLIDRGEVSTGVSGGPSSGAIYELHLGTEPSHNEYFNRVATYLRRLQEEKEPGNA